MSTKARLSQMNTHLKAPDAAPQHIPEQKKEIKSAKPKTPSDKKTPKATGDNIPRGERSNFLKITVTIPSELLSGLRSLGMDRKARGERDTDVSSLLREAAALLLKH